MSIQTAATPQQQLELVVENLCQARDPRQRQWLIIPGQGRAEWVQRTWAKRAGIAGRSQLLMIRALLELTARGDPNEHRPLFDRQALVPVVSGLIPQMPRGLLGTLQDKFSDANAPVTAQQLAWAEVLAAALDDGLLARPTTDNFAPGLTWLLQQATVQEKLVGHLGQQSDSDYQRHAEAWQHHWQQRPGGVPKCHIVLDTGLPAILQRRLMVLHDIVGPDLVNITILEPAPNYWGDLATGRHKIDRDDAGPLLRPFGRRLQDLHRHSIDAGWPVGGGEPVTSPSTAVTALAGVHSLAQAIPAQIPHLLPSSDDSSISIHSCPSALRELEVCRDRILQALHDDPHLRCEDILLLVSDGKKYGPLVAAALQPQNNPRLQIPTRIVGIGTSSEEDLATAIAALVHTCSAPMTQAVLLNYFEQPLLKHASGINESGATILKWLQESAFTWGHDERERQQQHPENNDRNSLHHALQRLALGAIAAPTAPASVITGTDEYQISPLTRVSGIAATDLAYLALWWQKIAALREQWRNAHTVADWSKLLATALQQLVLTPHSTHSPLISQQIEHMLNEKLSALAQNTSTSLLNASAYWRWLEPQLAPTTIGLGGGGGITVAPLITWAGTPAKMVLIAGLGSEHFPRQDQRPPWHPLQPSDAAPRQAGDPSSRDDDRHALLIAVLAAADKLVLTYTGSSVNDSREQPPSTPLAELQQAIAMVQPDFARVHRHGLHGGSPSQCAKNQPDRNRPWLTSDYDLATALRGPTTPLPGPWTHAPVIRHTGNDGLRIQLNDLQQLFRRSFSCFAKAQGLRHEEADVVEQHGDLLAPSALDQHNYSSEFTREIWQQKNSGSEISEQSVENRHNRLCVAGDLPPGILGDWTWQETLAATPIAALRAVDDLLPMNDMSPLPVQDVEISNRSQLVAGYDDINIHLFLTKMAQKKSRGKIIDRVIPDDIRTEYQAALVTAWIAASGRPVEEVLFHASDLDNTDDSGVSAAVSQAWNLNHLPTTATAQRWLGEIIDLFKLATTTPIACSSTFIDLLCKAWRKDGVRIDGVPEIVHAYREKYFGLDNAFGRVHSDSEHAAAQQSFRGLDDAVLWSGPQATRQQIIDYITSTAPALSGDDLQELPLAALFACALSNWLLRWYAEDAA